MSTSSLLCEASVESDLLVGGGSYPPVIRHNLGGWESDVSVEHGVHVVVIHRRPLKVGIGPRGESVAPCHGFDCNGRGATRLVEGIAGALRWSAGA